MKMEYKLIEIVKKGFILTREPELLDGDLFIKFTNAPDNATAIFENKNGDSLYRTIDKEECSVPKDFLDGVIRCKVVVLDGKSDAPKFDCENIYTKKLDDKIICCPNGIDIPLQIVETLSGLQDVKDGLSCLSDKHEKISQKLDKLIEGYEFE